ncbi:MAG: hypothetical protein D6828_05110, partial [Nitrospirae bacterium]
AIGYGFFIPIFFIMVGVNFDLSSLMKMQHSTILMIILIVAAFSSKILPSMLFVPDFGMRSSLSAGFLLSSRLSLIIAAAEIGLKLGIISPGLSSSLIALAIFACFLSPTIYSKLQRKSESSKSKVIIVSGGKIGRTLAYRLKMHGKDVIVIDDNPEAIKLTKEMGINAINADPKDPLTYKNVGLNKEDYVVVATGDDNINIEVCRIIKGYYKHKKIIVRDNNPDNYELLRNMGVIPMNLVLSSVITLENLVLRPEAYHIVKDSLQPFEVADVVLSNDDFHNTVLKDIPMHKDGFILLIKRGDQQLIPKDDTILHKGDVLTVFGTPEAINDISLLLEGEAKYAADSS